jgi:hypothetical protein
MEAFKPQTIRNGFAGTGLYPFDPDRVIQKLHIQLRTPTPPGSRGSSSTSSYTFQTPQNPRHLQRHTAAIKKLIDDGRTSPSTPFGLAFQQLAKACETTMVQAALMKKQYDELFAAHEKEKQKRQRSKKKLRNEGGITREEAQELMKSRDEAVQSPVNAAAQLTTEASQPRHRAPPRCSDCRIVGHNRSQCRNRNPNYFLYVIAVLVAN